MGTPFCKYDLQNGQVDVWLVKVDFNEHEVTDYYYLLSSDEKESIEKFKFERHKIVYSTARGILRLLSGKYLNRKPQEIEFGYSEYGKPFYDDKSVVNFNVSHSGDMIVLAFSKEAQLGIDVEEIKDNIEVLSIANNFFSPKEIEAISEIPDGEKVRAFYRCWTRKESFIKAEGSGLSFPLDKFTVSLSDDETAELLNTDWDASEKSKWSLISFTPSNDYIGAIAVREKGVQFKYHQWITK